MTDTANENNTAYLNEIFKTFALNPEQIKRMFDDLPLGIIITDASGIIVYYNKAHSEIDGITPEEMLGRRWIEALVPLNGPNIMYVCQRMAKPILGYVYSYKTYKGRLVNAAYWVYPIFEDSVVTGSICFTQPLVGDTQARASSSPPLIWPGYLPISDPTQNIVGKNADFLKALEQVKSNAANSFSILISGEPGTGKKLLAKFSHQTSDRRKNPYLSVNCASIPGHLMESLLFGTTKGSFTGAIDRPGMLSEANGGTLFLDELDSMPLNLQDKLTKALSEMKASRIGSIAKEKLDFKLIASISSSPLELVKSKELSADLYRQVAVVLVDIPPLRNRLDDLYLLSYFLIKKYNKLLGKQGHQIDRRLWHLMKKYNWPENVAELEHMLSDALAQLSKDETVIMLKHVQEPLLSTFSKIAPSELEPKALPQDEVVEDPKSLLSPIPEDEDESYLTRVQQEERKLKKLLADSAGNVARAARKMGISRQLMNHRLKKYGIDPKIYR
ncbi:MAG: sigma 54-interacting transcriptional regulator [Deltaproteobacteria bacterium]|jgi:arginine utilization regulatory protein|nr:sigma 54-interacting transcriptional regulator [Deltaproteobacteria bacterium]